VLPCEWLERKQAEVGGLQLLSGNTAKA